MTESRRRPSGNTALRELIELAAVGLATTGLVGVLGVVVFPKPVRSALLGHASGASQFRDNILILAAGLVIAVVLAAAAAGLVLKRTTRRFNDSVWKEVFGEPAPDGQHRHVVLELNDGRTFEGQIATYSVAPLEDGDQPLIAIRAPIWMTTKLKTKRFRPAKSKRTKMNYDLFVATADQLKFAAVRYVPNPVSPDVST